MPRWKRNPPLPFQSSPSRTPERIRQVMALMVLRVDRGICGRLNSR